MKASTSRSRSAPAQPKRSASRRRKVVTFERPVCQCYAQPSAARQAQVKWHDARRHEPGHTHERQNRAVAAMAFNRQHTSVVTVSISYQVYARRRIYLSAAASGAVRVWQVIKQNRLVCRPVFFFFFFFFSAASTTALRH